MYLPLRGKNVWVWRLGSSGGAVREMRVVFTKQLLNLLSRYPEVAEGLEERAHEQIRTMAEQMVWELREVLK